MSKYIKQDDVFELVRKGVLISNSNFESVCKHIGSLPTIEVSEDCISREWVKGICEFMLDEEMLGHMLGHIEDAPSVVPTTEQSSEVGEWVKAKDSYEIICSKCEHEAFSEYGTYHTTAYCPYCGAKMKG